MIGWFIFGSYFTSFSPVYNFKNLQNDKITCPQEEKEEWLEYLIHLQNKFGSKWNFFRIFNKDFGNCICSRAPNQKAHLKAA